MLGVKFGITIQVEKGAGINSGFEDYLYEEAGCHVVGSEAIMSADVILSVKGPLAGELLGKSGATHIRFVHGAAVDKTAGREALEARVRMITLDQNMNFPKGVFSSSRPVLDAMSQIAGRLAVDWAHEHFPKLLKEPGSCFLIGAGNVGQGAMQRLKQLHVKDTSIVVGDVKELPLGSNFTYSMRTDRPEELARVVGDSKLIIGGALVVGKPAPLVVSSEFFREHAKPGVVCVDVSVDQGGCLGGGRERYENGNLTTLKEPFGEWEHGFISCVPNMPSAAKEVSSTAFSELVAKMLPFIFDIENGWAINMEVVADALIMENGEPVDEAFAKQVAA